MRAAGNRNVFGVECMARSILGLMRDDGVTFNVAAGRMMIAADEIWSRDEEDAFYEAVEELKKEKQ